MLNIAVFASGKGSNFKAILEAIEEGTISNARIVCVISNNAGAGALMIAREHCIPAIYLNRKHFETDQVFNQTLQTTLQTHGANFIVLAGYLKRIDPSLIQAYRNRIVNVHPALLPAFGGTGMYGIRVHQAVIASKAKQSGATVHIVDEEYDQGAIVLQRTIDVTENDTVETLSAKVLKVEHELYPEAIRLFAEGKVSIDDHRHTTIAQ
ncbi:MAG: phosphoribosylglycinamide formyltransferase [Ignavibacteriae bacterium]|nr:phosphoribosylglycinamide formyltransferase [Ignavibacteria bacterium]MBI3363372.1 phosphoribosylglycinamide formyltransferase [Ignavibacteriota bacterium]